ncbi:MAG: hypothetical protein M0Z43_10400, partial [Acidithiobacillus sp.]|nr:hypothetical protein [Acidithiobacillus sp.]
YAHLIRRIVQLNQYAAKWFITAASSRLGRFCPRPINKYTKDDASPDLAPLPVPPVVRWVNIRSDDLLGSIYHATLSTEAVADRSGTLTNTPTAAKRYTLEVVSMEYGLPQMAWNRRVLEICC